ncbi:MAG: hypothetical protein HC857_12390 [Synechococcales cyanobacterium RU_4_20]|nr:hypothetical protein [Synechococcales cyanobacterium RU_4_20]NJR69659.1 hypothetical protein [Synechococcales cyanobacterium CRU_2_2]
MKAVVLLTLMGVVAGGVASTTPAIAQSPPVPWPSIQTAEPSTPEALMPPEAKREIEAQIKDLSSGIEQEVRARIDPKAIERVARPVLRRSLRTVLDVAPGMSRQAVVLGEWYLGQLGDRALAEIENATKKLEGLEDQLGDKP